MARVADAVPVPLPDGDATADEARGEVVFESALRAILDASAAAAGAVCLFDSHAGALRLATAIGLSAEGCDRLRHVRTGVSESWDLPLLSVLHRRPYVIDGAAGKCDVPHLVEPATAMRTVACLPLYAGGTPEGSVVLVTLVPHALAETDLTGIEPLVLALAGLVHGAHGAADARVLAPVLPPGAPAELARVVADLHHAERGMGIDALLAALAGTERHRLFLTTALELTARAEHARAQAALAGAQAALASAEAIVAGLATTDAGSGADRARLAELEREVAALRAATQRDADAGGAPDSTVDAESGPSVDATPAPVPEIGTAPSDEAAAGPASLVVLDDDPAWDAAVPDGAVWRVPPGDDLGPRLRAAGVTTVIANLAAPGVLAALATARGAGWERPVVGCLAAPGRDGVVLLGTVDVVPAPLDTAAVVRLVVARFPRGTRVMTAGDDAETLGRLRTALVDEGMSVSMVWDAKQAADLVEVVRPGVVLVDLGLPRREGFEVVLRVADLTPVPATIVTVGRETPTEGFVQALADPQRRLPTVPRERALADVTHGRG